MDEPSDQEAQGLLAVSPAGSRQRSFESEIAPKDKSAHVEACRALQVEAAAAAATAAAAARCRRRQPPAAPARPARSSYVVRRSASTQGSHFLSTWGQRGWEFAVGLIMLELHPSSLVLVGASCGTAAASLASPPGSLISVAGMQCV